MKVLTLACSLSLAVFGALPILGGPVGVAQGHQERLETDLRRQLTPLVGVFDNVTFKVESDRTVTLTGQVRDPNIKRHVEEDAQKVEGVRSVVNLIEILPLSRSDDDLRLALYRAIYSQEGLQRYALRLNPPVHIVVKNGAVTLEGMVANKMEYTQVNLAANQVPGAFSVKNNLRVDGEV